MRNFFIFLLLLLYFLPVFAQGHEARLAQLDVQHYRFAIEVSDEGDEIEGIAEVEIKFLQPTKTFELDLTGPLEEGKGMTVTAVTGPLKGKLKRKFEQKGEILRIELKQEVSAGETRKFRIVYHGTPSDGLIIGKNRFGDRTFFGDNWPNRAHHYLPVVDHPSDKATVEFLVTAPDHYQVVSNGMQVEESCLGGGKKLTHWSSGVVLPTKVMVFGAADFAVQHSGMVDGVPVSSWVFRQQRREGFSDYAQAVKILKFYEDLIGDYPYEKLANVQSKTRYGGMENAGCIFYSERSVDGEGSAEGLIAHEIVHQWFGNGASEANWHHIWLSEGFATYLTHYYFEKTYGQEAARDRRNSDRMTVFRFPGESAGPIVDTRVKDWNQLLNPLSYQKGGWVLHMLRRKVGDKAFEKGIRNYYEQFKFGNAFSKDFRKVMEDASGMDLSAFFQQWLFRSGHPELEVSWKYKKGQVEMTVEQVQEGEVFAFPLEVEWMVPGYKKPVAQTVKVRQAKETFSLELSAKPEGLMLDPNVNLLFEGKVR